MGIVPILFSAAGAEVFSFVIDPPIYSIWYVGMAVQKEAPKIYDIII